MQILNASAAPKSIALWSIGFRPFFLSAAVFASVMIPLWMVYLSGKLSLTNTYESFWHGHEMIFGFIAAVFAGFLLTAVQNWTQKTTVSGNALFALWLLWLLGRVAPWLSFLQPYPITIAVIDIVFLMGLAIAIARPIIKTKQYRNYPFFLALLLLALNNTVFHFLLITQQEQWLSVTLHISLVLALWLMIKLGCRVIPMFTERGVQINALKRAPMHDLCCELSLVLILPSLFESNGLISGVLLLITAAVLAARIYQWFHPRIFSQPLVWILHLSFGFIVAGLLLLAAESFGLIANSSGWHAITVGGMGSLTIGMMARIALGHTGRSLTLSPLMHFSFYAIALAAIARITAFYLPAFFFALLIASSVLWLIAFAFYVWVYTPILCKA